MHGLSVFIQIIIPALTVKHIYTLIAKRKLDSKDEQYVKPLVRKSNGVYSIFYYGNGFLKKKILLTKSDFSVDSASVILSTEDCSPMLAD